MIIVIVYVCFVFVNVFFYFRVKMTDYDPPLIEADQTQRSCGNILRSEFQRKNLCFEYDTPAVFVSSQWPIPRPLFAVYRLLIASYAVTITFFGIKLHPSYLFPWPVWLTNWSFLLLTCHLLCAAVIVLLSLCFEHRHSATTTSGSIPCYMKLSWFLFSVAAPGAIIVTAVYYTSIFPQFHRNYLVFDDLHLHVMNSVLVVLEYAISAFPVRLLHVVYVWCLALVYVIFSAIYWAFDHSHVLYPGVLDWNEPATTVVVLLVLALLGIPLLQFVLFGIYQLRKYIYTRCACVPSSD